MAGQVITRFLKGVGRVMEKRVSERELDFP